MLTQTQTNQNDIDMALDSLREVMMNDVTQSLFTVRAKNNKEEIKTLLCIRNDEETFLPIAEMISGDPYKQYTILKW